VEALAIAERTGLYPKALFPRSTLTYSLISTSSFADLPLSIALAKAVCFQLPLSAGACQNQPFDWASLPLQVSKDAFEFQSKALDNCAAACACKDWQAALAP